MFKFNASLHAATRRMLLGLIAGIVIACVPSASFAKEFSKIVVFGDSLSDNGQLFALSGGTFPPFPYFQGRFSNGPVWVEDLAVRLHVPLEDHAFGGAFTDANNIDSGIVPGAPGMQTSVADYISSHGRLDPRALYIVWGGGNDYLNGFQFDPSIPVGNIVAEIRALAAAGAKSFLIPNLPDLGSVPATLGTPFSDLFNQLTGAHNAILAGALESLHAALHGDKLYLMDDNALVRDMRANPAAYGFSDVSEPAIAVFPASAAGFLFWDAIHPTSAGHEALAGLAIRTLDRHLDHGHDDDDDDGGCDD
jgi:thermolabile hemolysin